MHIFKINLSLILLFSLTFSDESAIKEVSLGAQEKKINHVKCELSHAKMFFFLLFISQFATRIDYAKSCLF